MVTASRDGNQSPPRKAWGNPISKLESTWVRWEESLAVFVLGAEIAVLVFGIGLSGLSAVYVPGGTNVIGIVFRAMVGAVGLGLAAHLVLRGKQTNSSQRTAYRLGVCGGCVAGIFLAKFWANLGTDYVANLRMWLQSSSSLTLVGGLRGLVTRLTLTLALLGASIATSSGKHINIDIAVRFIPRRFAPLVAITGWLGAAMVCFAATWGFVDGIAVTKFNAAASHACATGEGAGEGHLCDTSVSERLGTVRKEVLNDLFLLGRQISLDVQTAPKVLTGVGYDKWMLGADWNSWLKTASWEEHFPADALSALEASESALSTARMPAVVAPGANNASGLLIRDLNFVLPFGLLVIGLKFLLRTLQVLSGHVVIDLEAAHGDMMSGNTDEHSSDTAKESL